MAFKFFGIGVLISCSFIIPASSLNEYSCKQKSSCEESVQTSAGWVCGQQRSADDGTPYASFRGIPYGKPPLGARRFQELEPVEPWSGLFDATEDAPACPQTDFRFGRIPLQIKGQSEDCIYLNVHVSHAPVPNSPDGDGQYLRPVLVYIHGGLFQSGSGLTDFYGPEYLMTQPVVVITFNYRLNVFGFLSLNTKEIPGNQGLRDMLTLLKWVQTNVQAFGGDPDNVTLMGQSVGGTAAHILALSKVAKGLFQRLILTSGTAFPNHYTTSPKYAKKVAGMFLQEVGINSTDSVYIHNQLTKMPLLKIMAANVAVQYKTGLASFTPVVESKFSGITRILDAGPLTLIAKGRGKNYPSIVSFTNHEMDFARWLFTRKNLLGKLQQDRTGIVTPRLKYSLSKNQVSRTADIIYETYFPGGSPTLKQVMTYYTDLIFKHSSFNLAQWRVALGGAPMYMYEYSYEARYSPMKAGLWVEYTGAAHMDDLASIFRFNSMMGDSISHPQDEKMRQWMVSLITNFMTCEKPLCDDPEELWPPVSNDSLLYNEILKPFEVTMKEPTKRQREIVDFFDSIDPEVRNITARLDDVECEY